MSDRIDVVPGEDGAAKFAVSWLEPVRYEFSTRLEAERFAAWLNASGALAPDGTCRACSAHHEHRHGCPGCGADLGLRVGFNRGANHSPAPVALRPPDRFLIAREQHRIRLTLVTRARQQRLDVVTAMLRSETG